MANATQVLIFNKAGQQIAEIEPRFQSVTWRLNNVGRAQMYLPYSDAKCTPAILQPGNRLLIRFENGLPDFGGVIDFPQGRDSAGVGITAYTAEQLLGWRVTPKALYMNNQTPGAIFRRLLLEENATYTTGIELGTIDSTGTGRTLEYHYHDLLRRVLDLAALSGQDFHISSTYASGGLTFYGNWYARRGVDKSDGVLLVEDLNVGVVTLDEQGTVANRIILAGAGQTWGDERMDSMTSDATSRATYGYREWSQVQSGVVEQATLDRNAATLLADMKNPRLKFSLTALDAQPALFADYDVGDIVQLQAFLRNSDWAYDDKVRVIARQWDDSNVCRLEVEAWYG